MIRKASDMRIEVREKMRGGEGTVTIRHLFERSEFAANVRLCATLTLPPGASIGPHTHEGEDEVYLVTRGQGVLDDGERQTAVGPGDAVLTGRGQAHAIRHAGGDPLEIVALIICYG